MVKEGSKFNLKKILYVLSILIVYVSFVQLSINTFMDKDLQYPEFRCEPSLVKEVNQTENTCQKEYDIAYQKYDNERKKENLNKFIVSLSISLLTLLAISYWKVKKTVNYGLFAGLSFNLLVSMAYVEKSYIAVALLFAILLILIYYINKDKDEQ